MVGVSDNHSDAVYIHPRQIADHLSYNHQIFTVNHHVLVSTQFLSPASLCLLAAVLFPLASLMERLSVAFSLDTIPPIQATRFLAEAVPEFKFFAFLTKPSRIFIFYNALLSMLQRNAIEFKLAVSALAPCLVVATPVDIDLCNVAQLTANNALATKPITITFCMKTPPKKVVIEDTCQNSR